MVVYIVYMCRPGRPSVRLEREIIDGVSVVHNYGHGGSGITVFQVTSDVVTLILWTGYVLI